MAKKRKLSVAFVHPDLGLGGAERLVVDAAAGLRARGHAPVIYTPHLDRARCFAEALDGRAPAALVRVPFPRAVLGRLQALCASVRCVLVALWVCVRARPDAAVVDIVTAPLAVFHAFGVPALFYCHFPDKELARALVPRSGRLRDAYRALLDAAEGWCLAAAGAVAVNSKYTRAVFRRAFPAAADPAVVHPCVAEPGGVASGAAPAAASAAAGADAPPMLLSLNRFERKKNVALAIDALALLRGERGERATLVVAGGWDARVRENVEHLGELRARAALAGVQARVSFLRNVGHAEREKLMRDATAVLYTPSGEHFGIVPLEAMAAGTPVVAVDDAGPRESVVHGETGFLCPPTPQRFADAVAKLVDDRALRHAMGAAGRRRVRERFSRDGMAAQFERLLLGIV